MAVQVLGAAFFFVISKHLSVDDFGVISWSNAVAMMLTTILGFGLEQVVVRRIAASKTSEWAAAAYLIHILIGSFLSFAILLLISSLPFFDDVKYKLLPWFFVAQALINIGTPLKQFLNAKQQFTPYGIIAIVSNSIKLMLAFLYIYKGDMNIHSALVILIICASLELVSLCLYVFTKTSFSFKCRYTAYKKLLKESLPQYLAAIFDSSLSRMDWILLGLISTDAVTGEYSFAYRAFELSRLPIFIIAPIILSFFSRLLAGSAVMKEETQSKVNLVFIGGAFLSVFIPLSLNILWSPVMNELFDGKYGSTNSIEFLLLSACLPLQFFINISWTICFASKKYKQISFITVITAVSNLALNLVFIKLMGGQGAAIAFLLTTILQMLLYYNQVRHIVTQFPVQKFILLMIVAAISYYVSISVTDNLVLQLLIVVAGYTSVSFLLKLINKANFTAIQLLLKK